MSRASADGIVKNFYYWTGELVSGGAELIEFEKAEWSNLVFIPIVSE